MMMAAVFPSSEEVSTNGRPVLLLLRMEEDMEEEGGEETGTWVGRSDQVVRGRLSMDLRVRRRMMVDRDGVEVAWMRCDDAIGCVGNRNAADLRAHPSFLRLNEH